MVARARCRALLAEATVEPSSSAVSSAEKRSTSRRMSTARWRGGRCCSAATKASRTLSRSPASSAGSVTAGVVPRHGSGSSHSSCGRTSRSELGHRRGRAADLQRGGPAPAAADGVDADVGGDPVQPRAHARAALEAVLRAPGADQGLLHRVLGVVDGAEHPVAVAGQLAPVGGEGRVDALGPVLRRAVRCCCGSCPCPGSCPGTCPVRAPSPSAVPSASCVIVVLPRRWSRR